MKLNGIILLTFFLLFSQACIAQFTPAKVEISKEKVMVKGEIYLLHTVEKQQTLFSIARAYGTETGTILKDNPSLSSGLRAGDRIYIRDNRNNSGNIAKKPVEEIPEKEITQGQSIEHVVRWYESLFSIAKKYGVTEDEIIKLNSLSDKKVETRQKLRIPINKSQSDKVELTDKNDTTTTYTKDNQRAASVKEKKSELERGSFSGFADKSFSASLILPLGGNAENRDDRSLNFFEFYQGFLVALEDVKRDFPGSKLEINVFDSDAYKNVSELLTSSDINKSDIIIGPVYSNQIESVLDFTNDRDIPVISPVDPASENLTTIYPNLYQVSTPLLYQQKGLFNRITRFSEIAVIWENGGADEELVNITRNLLSEKSIEFREISYDILSGREILPKISEILAQGKINHVIVASNSEAFVSDVLRNLNLLQTRNGFEIAVYGTPSWRRFENVDLNYYHTMKLSISMQNFIDYTSDDVKRFLSRFRALYGAEPSAYAFQAYDIARFFLGSLLKYGSNFGEYMEEQKTGLLQTDFHFVHKPGEKGFTNSAVRQIIYKPDYSIDLQSFSRKP
ncbi:MAG: LysM peptidoglycan-binding domain-containing protein [Bacteroidales bacterium]